MIRLLWFALPLSLVACGPGPGGGGADAGSLKCHERPLTFSGTPGQAQTAELTSNVFAVPLKVGNTIKTVVVDTGAPVVVLDPTVYSQETLPTLQGTVSRMEGFGLRFTDAPVVAAPLGLSLGDGPLGGLVGGELICHFVTAFNYREPSVTLGAPATPVLNVLTPVTVDAPVEGGQSGGLAPFPATRIAVTALVEGKERRFVIDTGASFTVLTPEFFNALVADGHKSIMGPPASTVMGAVGTKLLRVKSLAIGAAEAKDLVVGAVEGNLLPGLATEVGHPIDGLIGGTYLREFLVSMDYPAGKMTLSRYATQTHVVDEFIRVGAALRQRADRQPGAAKYDVGYVFPNTDAAAKGLTVGTGVRKIDGMDLEALTATQVDRMMVGKAGETRSFELESGTVVMVKVDALL